MSINELSYGIKQRIHLIDYLLAMYGHVGRKELMSFFGISAPQATRDFKAYKTIAPENCVFEPSEKRYLKAITFKPLFKHDQQSN